jgi:hypothetical protein
MNKIEAINNELSRLTPLLQEVNGREYDTVRRFIIDEIKDLHEYLKTPATPLETLDNELSRLHLTYCGVLSNPDLMSRNEIQNELKDMIEKLQHTIIQMTH